MSKDTWRDVREIQQASEREIEQARVRAALVGGEPKIRALWHNTCDEYEATETRWILALQAIGIAAAHPEDGHIDRSGTEHDIVKLVNPYFNNGLCAGALIAIGDPDHYRVRRVQAVAKGGFLDVLLGNPLTKYLVPK